MPPEEIKLAENRKRPDYEEEKGLPLESIKEESDSSESSGLTISDVGSMQAVEQIDTSSRP
jgi:hypothetical protein